jgi:nitroreductase
MPAIAELIRDRHSTRGAFDCSRAIARPQLKAILEAAQWAPTPTNMQNFEIVIVDAAEQLEAIGKIPAQMSERFLRENYAQLSFSEAELSIKKTGMMASAFPKQWTDPEAWSPDAEPRSQLTFLGRSVLETPLMLVVLYDGDKRAPGSDGDPLGFMGLGCVMENMWLMAEELGIGMHVLTVFSDSAVEKEVMNALHIPPPMKIAFACALGYAVEPSSKYVRVRRDLEEFVHHNRFGHRDILWRPVESEDVLVTQVG